MSRAESSLDSELELDERTPRAGPTLATAALAVACLVAAGAFVAKATLEERAATSLAVRLDEALAEVRDDVADRVATHERIVARAAERIPQIDLPADDAWHIESSRLLRDVAALDTVVWLDAKGSFVRAVPAAAAAALVDRASRGGGDAVPWRPTGASLDPRVVAGPLPSGAPGLWCVERFAETPATPPSGYVVAGFDAAQLLAGTIARAASGCRVVVTEGTRVVCRPFVNEEVADVPEREGDVPGTDLTVRLVPTKALVEASRAAGATALLGTGLTLSAALALAGFWAGRSRRLRRLAESLRTESAYERRERRRLEDRVRALASHAALREAQRGVEPEPVDHDAVSTSTR